MSSPDKRSELREALSDAFPFFKRTLLFSGVTNILVLVPSLYMLEVYGRVVNSRSLLTLLMLTLFVLAAYGVLEALEWVRSGLMREAGEQLGRKLRSRVFGAALYARLRNVPAGSAVQVMGDLKTLREFLPSSGMLAIIDAPFAFLVLGIIFVMAPLLGWVAVAGALAQFLIGYFNNRRIRKPLREATKGAMATQGYASGLFRNAPVIRAMGMLGALRGHWLERQWEFIAKQAVASDSAGTNAALSKLTQSLLSSILLGAGCWLTLKGEFDPGSMIVASILGGKVLSPLVQIIGSWRQVDGATAAFGRLEQFLEAFPADKEKMPLPSPKGHLLVEGIIAGAPNSKGQILKGVSFRLAPGEVLAVVGPSAAGKTTLARLLTGVWPPLAGKVRLDGIDVHEWDKVELGPSVGFLPQSIELFDGTIAENVARFGRIDHEKMRKACEMAGLEGFIGSLSKGYDTPVGEDGAFLSGGQRQRVALARAVYGMPKFVVLDEPDSNLDDAGDAALLATIRQLKAGGSTVVVMTHRTHVLAEVDHLLVLVDGQVKQFGPRDKVLQALQPKKLIPAAGHGPTYRGVLA